MIRTAHIHRILALALVFALLLPHFFACGKTHTARDPLAYLRADMEVSVSGELWGIGFTGTLRHHPSGESALTFTAPAALAGITVSRCGDSFALSLGKNSDPVKTPSEHGMLHLLLPLTDGQVISQNKADGGFCTVIETAEGECYTVRTDEKGNPLSWESDGMRMEIEG